MNIIKFKAWDTKKKVMYSAEELGRDELQLNPDGRGFFNANSTSPRLSQYYPHLIPLQFTGEHDVDGNEIYDRDILYVEFEKSRYLNVPEIYLKKWWHEVKWVKHSWIIPDIELQFREVMVTSMHNEGKETPKWKIVGSFYTTPELLKR